MSSQSDGRSERKTRHRPEKESRNKERSEGEKVDKGNVKIDVPVEKKKKTEVRQPSSEVLDEISRLKRKMKTARTDEKECLKEYYHIFHKLQIMIRLFEDKVIEDCNSRDTYALNNFYSQQREVIADIRMLTDNMAQVEALTNDVLVPFTQSIVQVVTAAYYQQRALLQEVAAREHKEFAARKLDEVFRDIAKGIQSMQETAQQAIVKTLVGEEYNDRPRKKKR
jgi:hypothetical protein